MNLGHLFSRASLALLAATALSCSPHEEHRIPSGYVGDVFIVVGVPKGVAPERDGLARVYTIPPTGILVTQDHMSPNWHTATFYYVNNDGTRSRLPEEPSTIQDNATNRADRRPIVWFQRDGYRSLPCTIQYRQYYVGTRADLLSRPASKDEERFDSLIRTTLPCS